MNGVTTMVLLVAILTVLVVALLWVVAFAVRKKYRADKRERILGYLNQRNFLGYEEIHTQKVFRVLKDALVNDGGVQYHVMHVMSEDEKYDVDEVWVTQDEYDRTVRNKRHVCLNCIIRECYTNSRRYKLDFYYEKKHVVITDWVNSRQNALTEEELRVKLAQRVRKRILSC